VIKKMPTNIEIVTEELDNNQKIEDQVMQQEKTNDQI